MKHNKKRKKHKKPQKLSQKIKRIRGKLRQLTGTKKSHKQRKQNKCEHVFSTQTEQDPIFALYELPENEKMPHHMAFGEILKSKKCKICKFNTNRPPGTMFHICYRCWNPMKNLGKQIRWEQEIVVYQCTNESCGSMIYSYL